MEEMVRHLITCWVVTVAVLVCISPPRCGDAAASGRMVPVKEPSWAGNVPCFACELEANETSMVWWALGDEVVCMWPPDPNPVATTRVLCQHGRAPATGLVSTSLCVLHAGMTDFGNGAAVRCQASETAKLRSVQLRAKMRAGSRSWVSGGASTPRMHQGALAACAMLAASLLA
uniref:Uncharacterized protein LOC116948222 n=1 Tax=Petromyzon marinus TaxID=7757 RepID=A0AAJ7TPD6_PETMA|nr:uncharacterized protein LOC116948222 [Petromyzon marinus]